MRVQGWERRLWLWQRAAQAQPFAWGVFDCCRATCGAIEAVTGVDPGAGLAYSDEAGALQTIAAITGGGGLEQLAEHFAAKHGFAEISPKLATRGDVALLGDEPVMLAPFSCDPRYLAVVTESDGLKLVPARLARRAWRIG